VSPPRRRTSAIPPDEYAQFVEHPRYGRRPRITGLNPPQDLEQTFFHWHSRDDVRVPNTAISADLSRQSRATVPVTHYFDVKRRCEECGKPFLFFAEEQRYWYEELGFPLESDCVRCVPCRKRQQGLDRSRDRYEELFHLPARTSDQQLEFAECCLSLVEGGVFHRRQLEHVRAILKGLRADLDPEARERLASLWTRVRRPRAFFMGRPRPPRI
jgi:hypothetical protein